MNHCEWFTVACFSPRSYLSCYSPSNNQCKPPILQQYARHERFDFDAEGLAQFVIECGKKKGIGLHGVQVIHVQPLEREIAHEARRARIRFKDGKEKTRFVHTLNGSGLALPRTLIGILETYQRADGKIDVPAALRPYLGGETVLG